MRKYVITLLVAVISAVVLFVSYTAGHRTGYRTGIGDGAKMVVEGCYENRESNTAVLNGDTGHALLCQGVDTGLIRPGAGIDVLRAPSPVPAAGDPPLPETSQEIEKKLKDPHQT